jgi:hypothetical protein
MSQRFSNHVRSSVSVTYLHGRRQYRGQVSAVLFVHSCQIGDVEVLCGSMTKRSETMRGAVVLLLCHHTRRGRGWRHTLACCVSLGFSLFFSRACMAAERIATKTLSGTTDTNRRRS